ncbi:low-complexity protein [Candidatus Scalindua japonica]|uniref:Low-complexity protein n=1 Tax=Candidatus Scalindua japonica TaxID=1284222 RepID=A0A286U2U7_9BACT|nr:pentapeptide repeat-containing protein [Candidatus Scalindua japonica]GAX62391.1 low-complexity protein [Candidatus Scalindua japonica]
MADITREKIIKRIKRGQSLERADLSKLDFSCADLSDAKFRGVRFTGAFLGYVNLSRADLSGADLSNAKLHDAILENANLNNANLDGVNLKDANLKNSDLKNANLQNSNLKNANLRNSCLVSADFENADLTNADISGANIFHYKTYGWKIDGIKCTHIYNYPFFASEVERVGSRVEFAKKQFEEKYKMIPTIKLLLSGGLLIPDLYKICRIIGKINKMYKVEIGIVGMELEMNRIIFTLKDDSNSDLEKIGGMIVQEYENRDLDNNLLEIIKKNKQLCVGLKNLDIYEPHLEAPNVFSQPFQVTVDIVNKGLIDRPGMVMRPDSASVQEIKMSVIDNYINNEKEINKVLIDFDTMVSKEMQNQVKGLKNALKKKKVDDVLVAWKMIKKMFDRTEEITETDNKASPLPYRAIELYHKLDGWFGEVR